jgi:serine/threonine-protein kinase
LRDPKTEKVMTIDDAPMTEENRWQIWEARNKFAFSERRAPGNRREPPKISPFTEVRYEGEETVAVRVRGQMYRLVSIDGIATKQILQSARDHFGDLWQKRFAEDLVEVLWAMDHRPGESVRLELIDPKTEKAITIDKAPMTEANRQKIWYARRAEADES